MKSSPSNAAVFMQYLLNAAIGDNQKYLKRTIEESHIKSEPSNMVLESRVY